MVRRKHLSFLILSIVMLMFSACSNTKFLKDDQLLYTGRAKVKVVHQEKSKAVKQATSLIDDITFAKPNNSLFGTKRNWLPIGLWSYNYLKPKKEGKKGSWFYRKLGKKPILISDVNPEQKCKNIESALFANGFFNAKAGFAIEIKKSNPRKAKISYNVVLGTPYIINKILNPNPVDSMDIFINNFTEKLSIKPGDVFNIEKLNIEKQKLVTQLLEQGYYFIGPGNIEFIADTITVPFKINLLIRKKNDDPAYLFKKYKINEIHVDLSANISDSAIVSGESDTTFFNGIHLTGFRNYLTPAAITRCIQFTGGDIYSTSRHQGTIKQLNNYGVFRYVKVQFVLADTLKQQLNLFVQVSPKNNVNLNLEAYVQAKSTGFVGPGIEAALSHDNMSKSANKLQLSVSGGFEWQIGKKAKNNLGSNSYNIGFNTAFIFPRLVLPFKVKNQNNLLVSKTICDLGFEFLNNVQFYRMNSINTKLSYQWKKRKTITNIFSPIRINMVNLLQTTGQFDSIVEGNIYVRKSFEEQSILGMEYTFIFDNTFKTHDGIFFKAILGSSGTSLSLINSMIGGNKPYTLLGNVYSQFLKSSIDLRYFTANSKKGFVFRLYSGVGYSYGNSVVMPYVEQFYSGGSTSIRGFTARSLGPGSYKPTESNGIIDQTGDIKMEFNMEYRVGFTELIKGALFADVGNVWLLNVDENRPGAQFKFKNFTEQLAVSSGFGLRFDFNYFVLRTDLGLPLRNTYATNGKYWFSSIGKVFSNSRLNIAIGYPF